MHDYVIIGGGIVGLATAMAVGKSIPKQGFSSWKKGRMLRNTRLVETAVSFIPVFITNPEV
jgi:thioredoxin reductase